MKFHTCFISVVILLLAVDNNVASGIVEFPGKPPGKARAFVQADNITLENDVISAKWKVTDGKFIFCSVTDKLNRKSLTANNPPFTIIVAKGKKLTADQMNIVKPAKTGELTIDTKAFVYSNHIQGKEIALDLTDKDTGLKVRWRGILRNGSNYIRQHISMTTKEKEILVEDIVLIELTVPDARVKGRVRGSPATAARMFFGFEHPMSENTVIGSSIRCSYSRNTLLIPGENYSCSSVIGVAPEKQLRRAFLCYIERERAHPYRPFLHYNSWYDLRSFSEGQFLYAIRFLGKELCKKRDVVLSSYMLDDGWDDVSTVWEVSRLFPNGLEYIWKEAKRCDVGLGIWLSPWGGYGDDKRDRINSGRKLGFEIKSDSFSLSGPKYYKYFHNKCVTFAKDLGVNMFKFDGIGEGNGGVGPGDKAADFDAAMRLFSDLRDVKGDIYINLTTGSWPSPFWLLSVDSVWRSGRDYSFGGKGTQRQKWITYRDGQTYNNVVTKAPLYPITSLMVGGIIYGSFAMGKDPGNDFEDEVRSFFACGTQLQELYITPGLLTDENWNDLAESANWSYNNANVLVDTHWIGGNPNDLQVYGWAAWSPQKGFLSLRNPNDIQQEFSVDVANVFELPGCASREYVFESPYSDQRIQTVEVQAGKAHVFVLKPFEVLVFDALPVNEGNKTRLEPFAPADCGYPH